MNVKKVLQFKDYFSKPKAPVPLPEAVSFVESCRKQGELKTIFQTNKLETFRDIILVYALKYPDSANMLEEFLQFINALELAEQHYQKKVSK